MSAKAIVARMDDILKPVGFGRKGKTWNRTVGEFIDVVDVQTSKGGDGAFINAGVFHPDIYEKCWGSRPTGLVQEPECIVRVRMGNLVRGETGWWPFDDEGAADDVAEKVAAHVLPFFERMHSFAAMETFLDKQLPVRRHGRGYPPEVVYYAILKHKLGDKTGACELLTELERNMFGDWKELVGKIATGLSCP